MKPLSARSRRTSVCRPSQLAIAAAALALLASPTAAQLQVMVSGGSNPRIQNYADDAQGGAATLSVLAWPWYNGGGLAYDTANREFLALDFSAPRIDVFARGANGSTPPLRTIAGPATKMHVSNGIAVDAVHNEIIVTSTLHNALQIFSRTANGNVAPLREIVGPATGLNFPVGVAVDPASGEIFVANGGSLLVFNRTAGGNVAPKRVVEGPNTKLGTPSRIAFDPVRDELLVTDNSLAILTFARTASGDASPKRRIAGSKLGLKFPTGIATLGDSEVVVADGLFNAPSVVSVYDRDANGDVAPKRTIAIAPSGAGSARGVVVSHFYSKVMDGRFLIDATWRTAAGGVGGSNPTALAEDTAFLWFFSNSNVEAVVKVLDGCEVNQRFWVFIAGLTNTAVELTVTDLATGKVRLYKNAQGKAFEPVQDTSAFATCAAGFDRPPVAESRASERSKDGFSPAPVAESDADSPVAAYAGLCAGLCLHGGRFEVTATYDGSGVSGNAHGVQLTQDTGFQWFFSQQNAETVVKVINGCAVNGRYWVFAAGLTNLHVVVTVTDHQTGTQKTYVNPVNQPFKPIQDTSAFATCP